MPVQTSPSGNPANPYNTSNPAMTPLQTLDQNNKDAASFNKAINLYGGNISSVNTDPNKPANNNLLNAGPVVTTTSARAQNDQNVAKLDTLTNGGVVSNVYGKDGSITTTYKDGRVETKPSDGTTSVNGTTPTGTSSTTTTAVDTSNDTPYTASLRAVQEAQSTREKELEADKVKRQQLYDDYIAKSDESHKQLLANIKTQFDQIRDKTTDSNSRFNAITNQNQYLVNGFRYTPLQSQGMAYDAEQQGLAKIAAIDSQYANALQLAQNAKNENDYKALNGLMNDLDSISKERSQALQDIATTAKSIQDSLATVENMNQNQVNTMNSMMEGYGLELANIPADQRDKWFEEKAKEISKTTGTEISAAYVKSQMSRYDEKAKQEKLMPDKTLSQMYGVYTNAKGEPILTADGKQINYSPNDTMTVNQSTGQMIISGIDMYGNPTVKTVDIPGFIVANKEDKIKATKDGLYNVSTAQWITGPNKGTNNYAPAGVYTPPTGFESRGAGTSVSVKTVSNGIEIGIPSGTKLEGAGGWCGGFVNDFAKTIPGYKPVGDDYASKMANKNSDQPVAGGLVMWTPGKFEDNGHIGIVEKVFPDGSFQIYDANYVAAKTTSRRTIKPGSTEYNLIQSTGGFFDPNKVAGSVSGTTDVKSLGQYMKDNQPLGPGYSEKDVARFDEKIDRFVQAGDIDSMAKSYRDMLLRDTDFKKEFDNTQKFTRALDDVDGMINQYESAGKSTNALKAMAEKVARSLGMTTDTALAQLQTQMGFTLANYIRSISGTAASDVEVQRLMGNMASIGNVKELNTALVQQARNNATSSLKSMVDTRMYGLPEDLKPKVFGDIYTTSTGTGQNMSTETQSSNNNPLGI